MRSALQLLGGVAVAGAVAAGSTAFTAAGVTKAAGVTNFVGGKLATITVTGTEISGITYGFADAGMTQIDEVNLTFTDTNSVGATPVVTLNGGTWNAGGSLTCTVIASQASACTSADYHLASTVTSIDVAVS